MSIKQEKISKFLSFVLRHNPDAIGIRLDSQGWTDINQLLLCLHKAGKELTKSELQEVVDTNDKKRFTISEDGLYIRAAQGHSLKTVDIAFEEKFPPEILFHGTASRFLQSIKQKGLIASSRQHVHLTDNEVTAKNVGIRYGVPVILKIQARLMHEQGYKFYLSDNGVWLTNYVPIKFIIF